MNRKNKGSRDDGGIRGWENERKGGGNERNINVEYTYLDRHMGHQYQNRS